MRRSRPLQILCFGTLIGLGLASVLYALLPQQSDTTTPANPATPSPAFTFLGTPAEIPSQSNGKAVAPSIAPAGLAGKLVVRGKGGVTFGDNGGVSFGSNGQQNTDVAFLQFQGKETGTLFDTRTAGAVSFTLTSRYSYAERQELLKIPPVNRDFRMVFDVYQSLTQLFTLSVTATDGRLSFRFRLAGADGIYSFPRGQEEDGFGKGGVARIRMAWDGQGTGQFFVNDNLVTTIQYNARVHLNWTDASSFAIGASDQHNYSGGFYACDDLISGFSVWNAGLTANAKAPKVAQIRPENNATVSGVISLQATAEKSLVPVAFLSYRVDGRAFTGRLYYPYVAYLDTHTLTDGKHRLEVVANSYDNAEGVDGIDILVDNAGTAAAAAAAADSVPPQPVIALLTNTIDSHSLNFSWDPAADNVGAVSYEVYRDGQLAATVQAPSDRTVRVSYAEDDLSPSTTYSYQVRARDGAGNLSPFSAPYELTTKAKDGRILRVGPDGDYSTPCAAFRSAREWDTVEIDAMGNENYGGDVCIINVPHLTIRGVNGRPHIDSLGKNIGGKSIWLITSDNVVVENVEISGCAVPDNNGSAIRLEGKGLTLRSVYFHDNQNGVLASSISRGRILIENSEFSYNGDGTGQTHNLYISGADLLIFRYNYSHHALGGQLLKTRAKQNFVVYNRLTDETGQASYEIDCSNGGTTYVIGNIIQQSAFGQNDTFIAYGREGILAGYLPQLYVVNNTFINLYPSGRLIVMPAGVTTFFQNNLIVGPGALPQASSLITVLNNTITSMDIFPNAAQFDYRPSSTVASSDVLRAGVVASVVNDGVSLAAMYEYQHPTSAVLRPAADNPDLGALHAQALGSRSGSAFHRATQSAVSTIRRWTPAATGSKAAGTGKGQQ